MNATLCAGIDIGGTKKGFHLVILDGTQLVLATHAQEPEVLLAHCLAHHVHCIAVDAPCRWRLSPHTPRLAELEMARAHISCFSTPMREKVIGHAFYGWMFNGERMYQTLSAHYPILEQLPVDSAVTSCSVETFPHAMTCAYLGVDHASAKAKRTQRRALLEALGVDTKGLRSIDFLDAALCAISAQALCKGNYQAWGDKESGYIIVPKPERPIQL